MKVRVTDHKKFKRRVQMPFGIPLLALGMYIGIFTNIFFYGEPITFFVSGFVVAMSIAVLTYEPLEKD